MFCEIGSQKLCRLCTSMDLVEKRLRVPESETVLLMVVAHGGFPPFIWKLAHTNLKNLPKIAEVSFFFSFSRFPSKRHRKRHACNGRITNLRVRQSDLGWCRRPIHWNSTRIFCFKSRPVALSSKFPTFYANIPTLHGTGSGTTGHLFLFGCSIYLVQINRTALEVRYSNFLFVV